MRWQTANGCLVRQLLGGRSNVYAVSSGGRHLLLDSGIGRRRRLLLQRIDAMLGPGEAPLALILTHAHFDHAANAAALKHAYGLRVFSDAQEAELLCQGRNPGVAGTLSATRRLVGRLGPAYLRLRPYPPVKPDLLPSDAYQLDALGFPAYLLRTPGHTPGSLSLIVDDEIACVGDALVGFPGGRVLPPYALDFAALMASWDKLLQTGCRLFLPAHGKPVSRALLEQAQRKYSRLK